MGGCDSGRGCLSPGPRGGRVSGEMKDLRRRGNDGEIIGCREEESKNAPTAVY